MFVELATQVAALDDDAVAARLRELELAARRLEAELAAAVAEAERRKLAHVDGHGSVRGFLRGRFSWSNDQCTRRVRLARLVSREPSVGDALASGALGVAQADLLATAAANPRCGRDIGPFLPTLLAEARRLSFADFRTLVRRWATLADTDGAHRTADTTHAARRATLVETGGAVHLAAFGGALDGAALREIFERFCHAEFLTDLDTARTQLGDPTAEPSVLPRSDAQRRFDALRAIFEAAASSPPGSVAPEPVLNVVMDVATFAEHLVRKRILTLKPAWVPDLPLRHRRCETTNGTALTPEDALRVAMEGHIRRVVLDSDGVVINLGRKRRLFHGASAEALRLAMPRCGHGGCDVHGRRCQIDHLHDWQHGGPTNQDNGALRCPKHHRAKRHGFTVYRDDDGYWHTFRPDGTELLPL